MWRSRLFFFLSFFLSFLFLEEVERSDCLQTLISDFHSSFWIFAKIQTGLLKLDEHVWSFLDLHYLLRIELVHRLSTVYYLRLFQAKWLFTDTCHSQSLPRFKLDFSNLDKHVWSFLSLRYLLGNELVHRLSILFVPFPGVLYYTFSNWAAVPVRESARGISHPSFNLGRFKDGSSFFVSYHFFFLAREMYKLVLVPD